MPSYQDGCTRRAAADVEVSIVSLVGGEQLSRCLATLSPACAGLAWRLTVVDNSVSGLDLTTCLRRWPAATVVRSEGRRGFGANQNLALAGVVAERRARYALILNDDVELGTGSVTALVRYADEFPRIGAVAPIIVRPGGALEPSVVDWPTLMGHALFSVLPHRQPTMTAERGWLNGACMLVRTAALEEVGLFDPRYFLFFEETDLCRRLTDAGWHTRHCPYATIVHHKSQTTTRTGSGTEMEEQILRSQYLYFRKHHGRLAARVLNGFMRCGLLARMIKVAFEVAGGLAPGGLSTLRTLWALTLSRPDRPTRFELEASSSSPAPTAGSTPQRRAWRTGRS